MSFKQQQNGDHLEYQVAAIFQGEGYFVRRDALLWAAAEPTDIDVLAVKMNRPFQMHRVICDCKDKVKAKPYERIFWVKGLGSFISASELYVSLPNAKREIIEFAKQGQVKVLTQRLVEETYLRLYDQGKKNPFGLANENFYGPFFDRLAKDFRQDRDAVAVYTRSQALFLADDCYVSLNIAIQDLQLAYSSLNKQTADSHGFEIWRFIAGNLTVLSSYLLLCICSDTVSLPKSERDKVIVDRLTYGGLDPSKVDQFLELMNKLSLEIARSAVPQKFRKDITTYKVEGLPSPSYSNDICGLAERAMRDPEPYMELPRYLDFLIFELCLQNKPFSEKEWRQAFGLQPHQNAIKISKNVLAFLSTALKKDLTKILFPKDSIGSLSVEQRSIAKIVLGPQLETHHLEEKNPSPLLLMAKKIIDESLESGTINPCQGNQEQVNDAMQYLQLKGFIVRNGENFDLTELGKEFMGMLNKDQLPSTQKSE